MPTSITVAQPIRPQIKVDFHPICFYAASEHDAEGHCDDCLICDIPLCRNEDEVIEIDGLAVHEACWIADKRRAVIEAMSNLIEAEADLTAVSDEALVLDENLNRCHPYDDIFDLSQWMKRNCSIIQGWMKEAKVAR